MWRFLKKIVEARSLLATIGFGAFIFLLLALQPPPLIGTCVVGDVRALRAGLVPDELRYVVLDAEQIQVGVGTTAIEGWEGLGDSVVIAGRAFVRSTRRDSTRSEFLESGRFFQTSNLVYIPPGRHAQEVLTLQDGLSLGELWQQLGRRYPQGVLVAGMVHWQELRSYAMTRAPIDGLPLLQHPADYYTQPMRSLPDSWGYVVGLAASARPEKQYARLFARRVDRSLDLPIHVLILKSPPSNPARLNLEDAAAVGRAAGDSQLLTATLALYPLYHPHACKVTRKDNNSPSP